MAPQLDRRIVVQVSSTGRRGEGGTLHADDLTDYRVWCRKEQSDTRQKFYEAAGAIAQAETEYSEYFRIRYNDAIARAEPAKVQVLDDRDRILSVFSIDEPTDSRRRWLTLECEATEFVTRPADDIVEAGQHLAGPN